VDTFSTCGANFHLQKYTPCGPTLSVALIVGVSVGPHDLRFLHAGSNFRKPFPVMTCHTQCVYCGCRNLL